MPQTDVLPPTMLTPARVAEVLGVTEATVRDLVRRGELAAHRIGTGPKPRIRVAPEDLGAYLTRSRERQAVHAAGQRREARPR